MSVISRITMPFAALLLAALMSLCALVAVVAPASAEAKSCARQNAEPGSTSTANAEKAVLCLLNKQRGKRDLTKLARHKDLTRPAREHSKLMVDENCFKHVCPGEAGLGERLADYLANAAGGYGENIAYGGGGSGTPKAIVRSWMKSPGHKRNILDPDFEHIGIGVVWGAPVANAGSKAGTYTTDFGYREG